MNVSPEQFRQDLAAKAAEYYITKFSLSAAEHVRNRRNARIVRLGFLAMALLAVTCFMLMIHYRYGSFGALQSDTNKCQTFPDPGQRARCLEQSKFR